MNAKLMTCACAAIAAAAFGGPLDKAWIRGTTDKNPLEYAVGEEMTFTLTPMDVGEIADGEWFLEWRRTDDFGGTESGRAPFTKAPFVHKAKLDKPGFVRLEAYVVDKAGKRYAKKFTGDATTPEGKRAMNAFERAKKNVFFDGGAGADVAKLAPPPAPADLAEYWNTFGERLAKIPLKAERVLVSTDSAGYRIFAVSVSCAGIRPVTGYLTMPPADGKKYPARLMTHGYGGAVHMHNPPGGRYRNGEIVFDVNAFGILLPAFGGTEADRKALWWAVHDGARTGHAFSKEQNQDRDAAFFNGMVLRVKRALQYLKTLPEWDGQNLIAQGGSQGGLQTIWAAACGEGVTRAESGITWCCDMPSNDARIARKISSDGWYIPWTDALAYYDPACVARLIPPTCRTVVTRAGLGDYCCPPMGLAKLWNAIPANKQIFWMQGSEHGYVPPSYSGRDVVYEAK